MKKIIAVFSLITLISPQIALAASFNPNYIISDNDLVEKNALTVAQIQKFLNNRGGAVAGYKQADPWGTTRSAAEIIYNAAQYYTISPKYLIVTIQKEQSLITDTTPTQYQYDWATGYGVCDSCSVSDPQVKQYKGFYNQVNWAAKRNRYYIDTAGQWNFKVGGTYIIDGQSVTMQNQATVNLYTYTPHLHGNENFWTLWTKWFTKQYPDGSLLQVQGTAGVYLIQNGLKRPFFSKTALISRFDPKNIILVSRTDVDAYPDGQPIKYPNYSLLRSKQTGRIYLIDGNDKRYITSPQVFIDIGFNPEEVIVVEESDLNSYTVGLDLTQQSEYPTGVLLKSKLNGGIAYVQDGTRHPIMSREILQNRFPNRVPVLVEQTSIDAYPRGEPIKFKDGTLVTSPGANGIWVISNGMRRGITSKQAFDALGYKWTNIVKTNDNALLTVHPEGDPISVTN